jgi:hypothetical protein
MSAINELIEFWRGFSFEGNIHPDDRALVDEAFVKRYGLRLGTNQGSGAVETFFEQKVQGRGRLPINDQPHFDLTPVPYMGNLEKADIFLLMINPVLGYDDYGTDSNPEFRRALRKNIRQTKETCLALDTRFWWSSWFTYYEKLFRPAVSQFSGGKTYLKALQELSRRLAIIELAPYYSARSAWLTDRRLGILKSTERARTAAQHLEKKARAGEVLVIVRWRMDLWRITKHTNVILAKDRNGLGDGVSAIASRLARPATP